MSLPADKATIVWMYVDQHMTMQEIGDVFGVTRQAVQKTLKMLGVSTHSGEWVKVACMVCGKAFEMQRAKRRRTSKPTCSPACRKTYVESPRFKPWRRGARIARDVVGQHFTLEKGAVVHHSDGDARNNDLSNLKAFASLSALTKFRHSQPIKPIWDGAEYVKTYKPLADREEQPR